MDWIDFFTALGMMLVFEGAIPFLNPARWKRALSLLSTLSDYGTRIGGIILMIVGLLVIYLARSEVWT